MGSSRDAERSLRQALASIRRTAAAIGYGPSLGDPDALARRLGDDEQRIRRALAELMADAPASETKDGTTLAELVARLASTACGTRIELADGTEPPPTLGATTAGCIERVLTAAVENAGPDGVVRIGADRGPGLLVITVQVVGGDDAPLAPSLRARLLALRSAVLGTGGALRWHRAERGVALHLELPA